MKKGDGGEEIYCRVARRKIAFRGPPVIAVLIDRGTASSGEAVALAVEGQSRTRFFGRSTHGQTTATEGFPLSDGANLVFATAVEADRTGKVYPSGINPDVELPEETERAKSFDSAPMIKAAAEWMKVSSRCALIVFGRPILL